MKTFRFWTLALLAAILLCSAFSVPAQAGTFTVTLDKNTPKCTSATLCTATDVTSLKEGFWTFSVTVTGRVNSLGLQIKNSFPGAADFCWGFSGNNPKGTFLVTTSPFIIPVATTNACGTQWADTNGDPLSFVAYIKTSDPKAKVVITVTYPDLVALNGTAFKEGGSRAADTLQDQGIVEGKERYGKPSQA